MTDRRPTLEEAALSEKAERLELVLEGTRLGMWDWNPQTNEVHFDERWAQMLGYELSEIEQHLDAWQSRVHPDDLESCFADITAHMEGRADFYENVHRMKHRDGHWVHILDRGRIVERDAEGRPIRFTGTHTDVTEFKRIQQELQDRNRELDAARREAEAAVEARSVFLANMSHEIRTPLNGILGMAQLLMDADVDAEAREMIRSIESSGDILLTVINDILDFSKIESGKLTVHVSPLRVRHLVDDVCALHRSVALEKGLELRTEADAELPAIVFSDPVRLAQILGNLVSNAVKFTAEGSVRVTSSFTRTSESRGTLRIAVTDTGIGIAADKLESLFSPFTQADETTTRRFGGTGLGLAISRDLAELLGGRVEVSSRPGEGSEFVLSLHDVEFADQDSPVVEIATESVHDYSGMAVLVAEDNLVNQRVMTAFLSRLGIEADVAEDGGEAVEMVRRGAYDLVLMDCHMPGVDGYQAAREILADEDIAAPPVIVAVTASVMEEDVRRCAEAGMDRVLGKPFQARELRRTLADVRSAQARASRAP